VAHGEAALNGAVRAWLRESLGNTECFVRRPRQLLVLSSSATRASLAPHPSLQVSVRQLLNPPATGVPLVNPALKGKTVGCLCFAVCLCATGAQLTQDGRLPVPIALNVVSLPLNERAALL